MTSTIEDYGEGVRIERRFAPEPNGEYLWVCYQAEDTGAVIDKDSQRVTQPGVHPMTGEPTNYPFIWVPVLVGTEAEVRAKAEELSGGA